MRESEQRDVTLRITPSGKTRVCVLLPNEGLASPFMTSNYPLSGCTEYATGFCNVMKIKQAFFQRELLTL